MTVNNFFCSKISSFVFLVILCITLSCRSGDEFIPSDNALDAAREFIQSSLHGNFKKATWYATDNAASKHKIEELKSTYFNLSGSEKFDLSEASLIVMEDREISPVKHVILYYFSIDTTQKQLIVIKTNSYWLAVPGDPNSTDIY